ncbi:MAG: DNA repair exonuclease [Eggerthellaceae bacterium]|jgi:DNA repair exonuclease SbcCD nuclease subunit|nr:DNA repair exonuclease [Eggerthellaceae bacterium]MCH4221535.1 DNA repair exonuclease [Eggerthellaceae bacterium]
MKTRVTFIHAADLHLGAPFRGLRALSPAWADRLLTAIPEAYDRLIDTAIDHGVDFVIMAGDMFDMAEPSYADYAHFFDGLHRLESAHIPVYMCAGNHDPYVSWRNDFGDLPDNAYMFPADRPGFITYERHGRPLVLLGGRSYFNQSTPVDEDIARGISRVAAERACGVHAPFSVGVLHTGLDLDPKKAPTDPHQLRATNMDYWALGHIHKRQVDDPHDPHVAFSGCIQGRDIKETGARGCYEVTLTQDAPNMVNFISLASVVWQKTNVDVSHCGTLAEVHDAIMGDLFRLNGKAQCEDMVERVTLTGKTDLHHLLRQPEIIDDMRRKINNGYPSFFCDALIDNTRPNISKKSLKNEGLFPATLLRQSSGERDDPEGSITWLQDRFLEEELSLPRSYERNIETMQRRAETIVLDLLEGGDDR